MQQKATSAGALPRIPLGNFQRPSRSPSWFQGGRFAVRRGKEGKGGKGKGGEQGEEKEGRGGKLEQRRRLAKAGPERVST